MGHKKVNGVNCAPQTLFFLVSLFFLPLTLFSSFTVSFCNGVNVNKLSFSLKGDLRKYLEEHSEGKVLLLAYKNLGKLLPPQRPRLVHLIIIREINRAYEISKVPEKIEDFKYD